MSTVELTDATVKEWRCFHCDDVFTNPEHALEHFGRDEGSTPACKIRGSEGHLITYIRRLEAELSSYRNDSDLITRAWMAKEAEHSEALRREEEKGYARGVRDMTKQGCCAEPGAHNRSTPSRTFADRAADCLAIILLDWIDRGLIHTRTAVSDALESWADCRFDVRDGTGIQKLRDFAAARAEQAEKRKQNDRHCQPLP